MKNVLQILVFALAFQATLWAQVIPNGNFEEWETNAFGILEPVDWYAPLNAAGVANVTRVEGYNGGYAAELKAVEFAGLGVVGPMLISFDFPVTEKYSTLTGYLKGNIAGADTVYVLVGLYVDDEDDIVGLGFNYYVQDIADFTQLSISLFYLGDEVPLYGWISIFGGHGDEGQATLGTAIVIDELNLEGAAGISELSPVFGTIGDAFPNPASTHINIPFELKKPDVVSITITDLTGRVVYHKMNNSYSSGKHEIKADVTGLNAGTYFYSIIASDGRSVTKKFIVN